MAIRFEFDSRNYPEDDGCNCSTADNDKVHSNGSGLRCAIALCMTDAKLPCVPVPCCR